jgi:hypothetical protein
MKLTTCFGNIRIAVQTEDFSTLYLGDLEGGQLQTEVEDSAVLQGTSSAILESEC